MSTCILRWVSSDYPLQGNQQYLLVEPVLKLPDQVDSASLPCVPLRLYPSRDRLHSKQSELPREPRLSIAAPIRVADAIRLATAFSRIRLRSVITRERYIFTCNVLHGSRCGRQCSASNPELWSRFGPHGYPPYTRRFPKFPGIRWLGH